MSPESRDVDLCRNLIRYYQSILCPGLNNLLTERDRIQREYPHLKLGKPYNPSTYSRNFADRKATPSFASDLKITLHILTQETHDNPDSPYTPENLPILFDLHSIPKELAGVVSPDPGTDLDEDKTQEIFHPWFDGFDGPTDKMQLSQFEMFYELGKTIVDSDTPKTLYVAVDLGIYLYFLLHGIGLTKLVAIQKIVIRLIPLDSPTDLSIRALHLGTIYEMLDYCLIEKEEYKWETEHSFLGYMYGEDVIYTRYKPLLEPGYPVSPKIWTIIKQDDSKLYNRFYKALKYGKD